MSRNLFDDIFLARGLKGLLTPPDMDNAVPRPGSILGGFDYRKPFENAGLENTLAQTDTSFAPMSPPMSVNDIWRARALSAEFAPKPPAEPGMGTMQISTENLPPGPQLDSGIVDNPFQPPKPLPKEHRYDPRLAPRREENLEVPEVRAFLDSISMMEGAGYHTLLGDKKFPSGRLTPDLSHFPNRKPRNEESSAGAYQIQQETYDDLAQQMGLTGFDPRIQDLMAAQMLQRAGKKGEKSALQELMENKGFDKAVEKSNGLWTSLPGGRENRKSIDEMRSFYEERLKFYKANPPIF